MLSDIRNIGGAHIKCGHLNVRSLAANFWDFWDILLKHNFWESLRRGWAMILTDWWISMVMVVHLFEMIVVPGVEEQERIKI